MGNDLRPLPMSACPASKLPVGPVRSSDHGLHEVVAGTPTLASPRKTER